MNDDRLKRLIDLKPESLANELLNLSYRNVDVEDAIERLLATPDENVERFHEKLQNLDYWDTPDQDKIRALIKHLESMLDDLRHGVKEPLTGVRLVDSFFEADGRIVDSYDDPYDDLADVFTSSAQALFHHFAAGCDQKEAVANIILSLVADDDYGLRGCLVERATTSLPEPLVHHMRAALEKGATSLNRSETDL